MTLPDFDKLWDFGQPAVTEERFRELLPAAEAAGDDSYHAQLLTQIARAQGLQRQFAAAHGTLDEAEKLLTDDLTVARIRYLLERGRVFNSSKEVAKARPLFLAAWELASATGADFYTIDVAHMMGIIEPPERQLDWNLRALELAENSADARARKWLGSLYNNIGWTYHDLGQYEAALAIFEKALRWREEKGEAEPIRIARWCVARVLRSLGRVEEALARQQALLAESEASGDPGGYAHEEIAECLLLLDQREAARPHAGRAYEVLSQDEWLAHNEPARLERLKVLWQNA